MDKILGKGDRVRHYKGNMYQIIEPLAIIENTLEEAIVYGSEYNGMVWVRPIKNFWEEVDDSGVKVPRFEKCAFNDQGKNRNLKHNG